MNATRLFGRRQILGLLVAGELTVVGSLAAVAWHIWLQGQAPNPGGATPSQQAAAPSQLTPRPSPSASVRVPAGPSSPPTPGIRTDPAFLSQVTLDINREEVALEQLEWRIIHGATDAARTYIQRVVLPAISHAQRQASSR
jgi:hypothetical protein